MDCWRRSSIFSCWGSMFWDVVKVMYPHLVVLGITIISRKAMVCRNSERSGWKACYVTLLRLLASRQMHGHVVVIVNIWRWLYTGLFVNGYHTIDDLAFNVFSLHTTEKKLLLHCLRQYKIGVLSPKYVLSQVIMQTKVVLPWKTLRTC